MDEDQKPQRVHRNRRPLEEIQNVQNERRVSDHVNRTLIQPDGNVVSIDQGCRTGPLQNPVNPGHPPTPFETEASFSEANRRVISGNDPVRPADGQSVRSVSTFAILLFMNVNPFTVTLDPRRYTKLSAWWW